MIYRMSYAMFSELRKALVVGGKRFADENDVVRYINQTFGLCVEIKGIQLV